MELLIEGKTKSDIARHYGITRQGADERFNDLEIEYKSKFGKITEGAISYYKNEIKKTKNEIKEVIKGYL